MGFYSVARNRILFIANLKEKMGVVMLEMRMRFRIYKTSMITLLLVLNVIFHFTIFNSILLIPPWIFYIIFLILLVPVLVFFSIGYYLIGERLDSRKQFSMGNYGYIMLFSIFLTPVIILSLAGSVQTLSYFFLSLAISYAILTFGSIKILQIKL